MGRLVTILAVTLGLAIAPALAAETQLTDTAGDDTSPAWCSDGEIAFHSTRSGGNEIWIMDEAGEATNVWRITLGSDDRDPVWNAACTHVYFQRSTGGDNQLYYISDIGPPASPTSVSLGTGDDEAPHATATGVVFHSNRSGHDDIMWMPAGGESSSDFRTTNSAQDRFPNLSPDDSLIAFASDRGASFDIWLMDAAGESRAAWQLTSDAAFESYPAFNPTGDLVAFHRAGQGIFCIDTVTRLEYQITTNATDTQPCWSPDGMAIAFARDTGGGYDIWVTDNTPDTAVENVSWATIKSVFR